MNSVIRAPNNHGQLSCDPPLSQLSGMIGTKKIRSQSHEISSLAREARQDFLTHLGNRANGLEVDSYWVGTGHQPEIFHPGVWAKNFIAGGISSSLKSTSLHLVIDTDCPTQPAIRLPEIGLPERPRKAPWVPFAYQNGTTPWKSIKADANLAISFREKMFAWASQARFGAAMSHWLKHLELEDSGQASIPAWLHFKKSRSFLENEWGLIQENIPLSFASQFPSFIKLVALMICQHELARSTYNESVHFFRLKHQVNQEGRPVPFLGENSSWLELPLWLRIPENPQRYRFWLRREGSAFFLTTNPSEDFGKACRIGKISEIEDGLKNLLANGWEIWPRALTTTLYLRGFVFDCFVHGLGGALYDQVTEDWAMKWLGFMLKPRVAASLTMRLPLPPPRSTKKELSQTLHSQHHLMWNPDLLLSNSVDNRLADCLARLATLRMEKTGQDRHSKKRFHELRNLIEYLRENVRPAIENGFKNVDTLRRFISEEKMVLSREFAFPLHSLTDLQKYLRPLLNLRQAAAGVS